MKKEAGRLKTGDLTKSGRRVLAVRPADENHQVVTVTGGKSGYMKKPCPQCPWRQDAVGVFPAKAFEHSANTAYDMSDRVFACHESGVEKGKTCAGFLLKGAEHNLMVRLGRMKGEILDDVSDGGHELHESYADMAIANGVDPDSECLKHCR